MPLFKVWSEDKLNKKFAVVENFAELVLTGRAFDRLNWQHSGEIFDQNFSKKSNAQGFAGGGGHGRFWN